MASIGTLIGRRYLLHEKVGAGVMGVVYRATDRLTGQVVALKRVITAATNPTVTMESEGTNLRLALAGEFQLLSSLRHPNIISVLDYGFDEARQPYFTMELLTRAQTILQAGGDQPFQRQVDLVAQLLRALAYLHRRGILHRDLKPANILVSGGHLRVMDFGLSVLREHQGGEAAGTVAYMAPEVLVGSSSSEASDLYAVGVILYELFVGNHPFEDPFTGAIVQSVLYDEINFPPDINAQLETVLRTLLARDPAQRYQHAESVIEALEAVSGQSLPVETLATRESFLQAASMVGREAELEQMRAVFTHAVEGKGSAWLVGGESGVGKSRLLHELRTLALVKGALVLRGQAVSETGAPYAMWCSAIAWLALLTAPTDREAAILRAVVPQIEDIIGRPVAYAPEIDPRGAALRLFTTITDLLKRRDEPTVIVLEDLHWADADSLALLAWLSRAVPALPALIVASYRDDEVPDLPHMLPDMQVMRLGRLTPEAVARLGEQMLAHHRPEISAFLQRETEGNVFFLVETVRALAEEAGQLKRVESMALPEQVLTGGVKQVIARRLERVPVKFRPLLRLAAVAGRQIDRLVLSAAAPEANFEAGLMAGINAAVLEIYENQWRFAHDKLRDALLSTIPANELRDLHGQVARAIEQVYPAKPELAAVLAQHWGAAGEPAKEAVYAVLAGEQALASGAYQKARGFLERALALESESAHLLSPALLRCQLGETCYSLGDYTRARELLEESARLAEIEGIDSSQARSLNILGNIAIAFGDYALARERLERTVALAKATGNRLEEGKATRSLGVALQNMSDYDGAQRLYLVSLAILTDVKDSLGMAGALANLANIATKRQNYAEAQRLYGAAIEQFEAIDFLWGIAYASTQMGSVMSKMRQYAEARRLHERGLNICREIGHRWGYTLCLNHLALACIGLGEYAEAQKQIIEGLKITLDMGTLPMSLEYFATYADLIHHLGADRLAAELLQFVIANPSSDDEVLERARPLFDAIDPEFRTPETPRSFEALAAEIVGVS